MGVWGRKPPIRHHRYCLRESRVNSNSGLYGLYVGGNYNSSDNYGVFYTNANNHVTNSNANIGSRLMNPLKKIKSLRRQDLAPWQKYRQNRQSLVGNFSKNFVANGNKNMKRIGYLYEKMCNKKLIEKAIIKGSIGKKKRKDVNIVMDDVSGYVDKVYNLLVNHEFKPTIPKLMKIRDKSSGKERIISIVPFYPDGIMHQLCVMAMEPVLMRGMYHWSCASIPKRGNARAQKYVKRCLKKDRKGTKYCAKLDIRHCYPSINIDLMMDSLHRKIKDGKFLSLIRSILDSNPNPGLAIGYYLNQWLANYFLEPLDHYICTLDGVKHYVRNMDDLVLLSGNKKKLHKAVERIRAYLSNIGLKLKSNWQVFKTDSRGIDFVGYRFFHGYILLRRRNFLKLTRQCRKVAKMEDIPFREAAGLLSRKGMLKHCSGTTIRQKYYDCIGDKKLKDVVRAYTANQNNTSVMVGS